MLKPMSGRKPPSAPAPLHAAMLAVIAKRGVSGYRLTKDTKLPLRTVQRFIAGEVSPTLDTATTIADALGLRLSVEPITKR